MNDTTKNETMPKQNDSATETTPILDLDRVVAVIRDRLISDLRDQAAANLREAAPWKVDNTCAAAGQWLEDLAARARVDSRLAFEIGILRAVLRGSPEGAHLEAPSN